MDTQETAEGFAVRMMTDAFNALKNTVGSRENSLAMTKLEEAMMWCNKDRTIKGEFKPNETHVS
jgi:hypothetical protein